MLFKFWWLQLFILRPTMYAAKKKQKKKNDTIFLVFIIVIGHKRRQRFVNESALVNAFITLCVFHSIIFYFIFFRLYFKYDPFHCVDVYSQGYFQHTLLHTILTRFVLFFIPSLP